jgi:hypothetical protein
MNRLKRIEITVCTILYVYAYVFFSHFHIFYKQFCELLIEFVYVELQFSHADLGLHHTMSNPAVLEPPCYYDIFAGQVPAPNQQHLPSQPYIYYGHQSFHAQASLIFSHVSTAAY